MKMRMSLFNISVEKNLNGYFLCYLVIWLRYDILGTERSGCLCLVSFLIYQLYKKN